MTRDGEMGARRFVDLVLSALPGESDSTLLRTLVHQLTTAVAMYVDPARRADTRRQTLARLWDLARAADPGSDAQLQLVSAASSFTTTGDDTAYLSGLLDGSEVIDGLAVDTELRWALLTGLAGAGAADEAAIAAELKRDDTATGRGRAARARASMPTVAAKGGGLAGRGRRGRPGQCDSGGRSPWASGGCGTPTPCAGLRGSLPRDARGHRAQRDHTRSSRRSSTASIRGRSPMSGSGMRRAPGWPSTRKPLMPCAVW